MIIPNLVETHCHILPGIDDGARHLETSIEMINRLQLQGANTVILTPHYYSDSISYQDFVTRRDTAFNRLKDALGEDAPVLIPAAEVCISDCIFDNENLDKLCIGNSRYVLIEHPFSAEFSQSDFDRLLNLSYKYKIKPILAHIERYSALMEDKYLLDEYIDAGCLTQVNISSFAKSHRSVRKKLIKYLESGRIHLIGSDCHNLDSRTPDYDEGVKMILKKCGQYVLDNLIENANNLIK